MLVRVHVWLCVSAYAAMAAVTVLSCNGLLGPCTYYIYIFEKVHVQCM
jgi:hypothetical protein